MGSDKVCVHACVHRMREGGGGVRGREVEGLEEGRWRG